MRNFIIALILIAAIIIAVAVNSAFIRGECDAIISLVNTGDYKAAQEEWDRVRDRFGLFLRDTEIDSADLRLRELVGAWEQGDGNAVASCVTDVVDAFIEIKGCETPTFTGIF